MVKTRRDFLTAALATALPIWARAETREIRFGLTAVILADQAAFLSRWSGYLGRRIGLPVTFIARDSYQEILALMFSGKLNAAWICGYPYVLHEQRMRLLAVPIYQGRPTYQSYLIQPADAQDPIRHWIDLKGRVFVYSDPLSNSGWLVPQVQMRQAGIRPSDLRRAFFAHGHRNVAEAVAANLADAGSIDGYVWETMARQQMPAIARTRVVWKSEPYGFPPLVIPAEAAADPTLAALSEALMTMRNDDEGRQLLVALNLDAFAPASPSTFDGIRALVKIVNPDRSTP